MTRALIFDFGGTIDTDGCHWGRFIWHAFEWAHVAVGEADYRQAYVYGERTLGSEAVIKPSFTFRQTLREKLRLEAEWLVGNGAWRVSEAQSAAVVASICDHIYNDVCQIVRRNAAVLERLKEKYRLALVTNFYGNMDVVLREFGLDDCFECVVESARVGVRKPDERIFRMALDALGCVAADVAVIGDSLKNDIRPAHALGCRTVWLKGEGWTNGEEGASAADEIIHSLADIGL